MDKTIIYYTDNSIDTTISDMCYALLKRAASDIPIVEQYQDVSWERSYLSIIRQIRDGLSRVKTRNVALAEHDCIYTREHFEFEPIDENTLYFNTNVMYLNLKFNGHVSPRGKHTRPISQMICTREALTDFLNKREPVFSIGRDFDPSKKFDPTERDFRIKTFETKEPNFDIRHDKNFTGTIFNDAGRVYVH